MGIAFEFFSVAMVNPYCTQRALAALENLGVKKRGLRRRPHPPFILVLHSLLSFSQKVLQIRPLGNGRPSRGAPERRCHSADILVSAIRYGSKLRLRGAPGKNAKVMPVEPSHER